MVQMQFENWYASGVPSSIFIVELVIACLFAGGLVAYYRSVWQRAYETLADDHLVRSYLLRGLMLILPISGAYLVDWVSGRYTGSMGAMLMMNIALFLLVVTLMDRKSSNLEFVTRLIAALIYVVIHHLGSTDRPQFVIAIVGILCTSLFMWWKQTAIRYHIDRHSAMYALFGIFFWLFLPNPSQGMPTGGAFVVQGCIIFIMMSFCTTIYQARAHKVVVVNEENELQAHIDRMTDAWTYAVYKEDITQAFERAKKEVRPLTIAVFDIDHFKQINDHYGHLVGDQLLGVVSRTVERTLSRYDGDYKLYRTGGEEFNIIFPDLPASSVSTIVKDFWRAINVKRLTAGEYEIATTISVGVAQMLPTDKTSNDLYSRADANLYRSKHNGRNVVTIMGKTLNATRKTQVFATRTLCMQDIVTPDATPKIVGSEIQLAVYDYSHDRWNFPLMFGMPVHYQLDYVRAVLPTRTALPGLTIHLMMSDFYDDRTPQLLKDFIEELPGLTTICVIPERLPKAAALMSAEAAFHAVNISIALVAPETWQAVKTIKPLLAGVDCLRIAFDKLDPRHGKLEARRYMDAVNQAVEGTKVVLVVTGIETEEDAKFVRQEWPDCYFQGYYFDRPELPRLS